MFLEVAIIFCGTFSVFETKQEFFPVLVRSIVSHLKKRVYLRKKLPCVNVKVEPRSNLTFTRSFSYIVSILFTHVKPIKSLCPYASKNYATVEIHLNTDSLLQVTLFTGKLTSTVSKLTFPKLYSAAGYINFYIMNFNRCATMNCETEIKFPS